MVNEYYHKVLEVVKNTFDADGNVELRKFLNEGEYNIFRKKALAIKTKRIDEVLSARHSVAKAVVPPEVNAFIAKVCGRKPSSWELWSFAAGDYTVINDEKVEKPGIDAILDLTEDWSEHAGGALVYVDGSGDHTTILADGNKLVLVKRKKGNHRFIQYCNHKAGKERRVFLIARL